MILRKLAIFTTALALSSAAFAEGQGGPRAACKEDVHSLCKDVEPGSGRILQCLKEHKSDLSDGCKGALQKLAARKKAHDDDDASPSSGDSKNAPASHDDDKDSGSPN